MNRSLKRFARRILLVHLALLAVLLAVVFFASREVYRSARAQAKEQARKQQELLVSQTANGLRSYYDSIFSDLQLLKPVNPDDEDDTDDRTLDDEPQQSTPPVLSAPRLLISQTLAVQLNGRVSHLFYVQKGVWRPLPLGKADMQATSPTMQQVIDRNHGWINSVEKPTISPLEQFADSRGEVRGFNLIGVPVRIGRQAAVLVATVPVRATAKRFFDEVNRTSDSGAFLLDEKMTIMAASRPDQVGTRIRGAADTVVAAAVSKLSAGGGGVTDLTERFRLGSEVFSPAMVSVQPVKVLDKQWYVLIETPQSDVDAVVARLFDRAVFWAIFVAVSMTGILVSTAIQLIRTRAISERQRHALLEKELKQAREIQLHWLPRQRPRDLALDIATVNYPASRISGDFYNWFDLPDGRTVVAIGDVTGHGMAAAFLMATTQLLVRNQMPLIGDPGRCLEEINRQLCTQVFHGQFVTLQILVLDPAAGRVQIGTAGHPPPLLIDGESCTTIPLTPNLVLGVEQAETYATETFDLAPMCTLLLYTDGVLDAESPAQERFTLDRLRQNLNGAFDGAQEVVETVVDAVDAFRGGQPLGDDLTLVAIQLQPEFAAPRGPRSRRVSQPSPAQIA